MLTASCFLICFQLLHDYLLYCLAPVSNLDIIFEYNVMIAGTSKQCTQQLPSSPLKMSSLTMLHTPIDGGFDEGFTSDDEYYFDGANDQSWSCSFGTEEGVSQYNMPSLHKELIFV